MTDYVELHCHSYYSLLDGTSSPEALVERAAALGMPALALTDHDGIYGAPAFARTAREAGVHAIFGAELTLHDDSHLTLLVENATGWANLCALITAGRHNADKGSAKLPAGVLEGHTTGLIALSGCRQGRIARALLHGDRKMAFQATHDLHDLFGAAHFFIEMQQHYLPDDRWLKCELLALSARLNLPYVATNNVHYASREQHRLQDVLVSIRENTPLDHALNLRPNSEYFLKSGDELAPLFADCPEALINTVRIAQRCQFTLDDGLQSLPLIATPDGMTADDYLRHLCSNRNLTEREQTQLEYELNIIHASGLSNYFLVVWDIVRFAREQDILCQGRGSAANSLVAYRLGISPIHPFDHGLVFERFLSSERQVVPDIDMDFDAERREEVIQYVYQKYGHAGAAMACTFVTFRARSALRDAGKALGLPLDVLEHASSALDAYQSRDLGESTALREALGERLDNAVWSHALAMAEQLSGLPRHLGIHNGGMVISAAPLSERVPTEPATMADRCVVQWDKDGLEDAGMVKIDILGLRMLSVLADCAAIIRQHDDPAFRFEQLTFDDPAVYAMIRAADTIGVFQVESHAQIQVLPRLKPAIFNDLIVSISLIRPGPVQGEMVHPYLRRRAGIEPVVYPHPLLEAALSETLGVILFQEQVLKVARDAAGFSAGQGELLRRALGSKDPQAALERFQTPFLIGAAERGIDPETAQTIFDKLRAFGGYSFPKSHAASFAVIVYRSAWLKRYHPAAFAAALLNNQPMGFWSRAVIVNDAKRHDITVQGVDVNRSAARCAAEQNVIRLGLNLINGIGKNAERIVAARGDQPFVDLADFCRRVPLPRRLTEKLILAGGMDGWGISRRDLLWRLGELASDDDNPLALPLISEPVRLPALTADESLHMEAGVVGFSPAAHPLTRQRHYLTQRGILTTTAMTRAADGARVRVAGLLVMHQAPPTAKGFHFLTLEDEFGMVSIIVRPQVYVHYRKIVRHAPLLVISGTVQHEGDVVNLLAKEIKAWQGFQSSSKKESQSP
jgi:error-prone DNA polymerase